MRVDLAVKQGKAKAGRSDVHDGLSARSSKLPVLERSSWTRSTGMHVIADGLANQKGLAASITSAAP